MEATGTAARILDAAQALIQTRGYSGFSYADISAGLAITKPAVHYHFGSKNEMGLVVTQRYRAAFLDALAAIEARTEDAQERLDAYADLFVATLTAGRVCLCGSLAAESELVPEAMRVEVTGFFADNVAWLAEALTLRGEELSIATRRAEVILAGLEGAMLMSRTAGGIEWFKAVATEIVNRRE